jgi:citrate lyase beta subunit
MQHFSYFSEEDKKALFLKLPEPIGIDSHKKLIAAGLGASLYSPATRATLAQDVIKNARRGVASSILCLEDSIPDDKVEEAEINLTKALSELNAMEDKSEFPLLFVRIRNAEHLDRVTQQNESYLDLLTGFVFPKFEDLSGSASDYLYVLNKVNEKRVTEGKRALYFMPVLESPQLVYRETRHALLNGVAEILSANRDIALAVRIGATDMASPFGLRRSRDLTIYDVHVVSSAIADIVNTFGRANKDGYVITGAVWEHFTDRERLFKPRLRQSPFNNDEEATKLRHQLILKDLDGLIREIELDRANGLLGKTVIHPLHVALVNSMSVVTHEEYSDAMDIVNQSEHGAGARASVYRNKMNEQKPHYAWAKKTLWRASAFGVANEKITFVELLEAAMRSYV